MVKHIVMFKLKDFAEGANKKENALKIKSSLEGLKSKIKEVKYIEVGLLLVWDGQAQNNGLQYPYGGEL